MAAEKKKRTDKNKSGTSGAVLYREAGRIRLEVFLPPEYGPKVEKLAESYGGKIKMTMAAIDLLFEKDGGDKVE